MEAEKIQATYERLRAEVSKVIIGQDDWLKLMAVALFCEGHVLIEGVPGLAKTLAIRTLAACVSCRFRRIQFYPDLMPSDIVGTSVYHSGTGDFVFRRGPIFTQFLLADEINRASAKTQSALLEAMQEREVTVDGTTHGLDGVFMVFASQNPIEHEGTYPLPEAQLDRFLFKLILGYPSLEEERQILRTHHIGSNAARPEDFGVVPVVDVAALLEIRDTVRGLTVSGEMIDYVARLTRATRDSVNVSVGASPRGGVAALTAAKGLAALEGRDYVIPDDVQQVFLPALRHRVILNPAAELEGVTADRALELVLESVPVPR